MSFLRIGLFVWLVWRVSSTFARLRVNLSGTDATIRGHAVRWRLTRRRSEVVAVDFGVPVEDRLSFTLRRERPFDRFAKSLGVADELQVGNADFDDHVYVLAEDDAVRAALREDDVLRGDALRQLHDETVESVRCRKGWLWIRCAPTDDTSTPDKMVDSIAEHHLAPLLRMGSRLHVRRQVASHPVRDVAALCERALYACCLALVALALVGFAWIQGHGPPRTLVFDAAERYGALAAGGSAAALAAFAAVALRGTSRLHLVMLEILVTALPAAWFIGRTAFAEYNVRADDSPRREIALRIADRTVVHRGGVLRRRNRKTHYLSVEGWRDHRIERRIVVSEKFYRRVRLDDCLVVGFRSGRLGDPWIDHVEGGRCPETLAPDERRRLEPVTPTPASQ